MWKTFFCLFAFFVFPVCILVFHLTTRHYLNPYKLIFIFAKKGQGKSTLLTKMAIQHLRKGWTVYSTESIPGCYKIDPEDIGFCEFPPHSLVVIDEVGMIWDNRGFKNFKPEVRDWFKILESSVIPNHTNFVYDNETMRRKFTKANVFRVYFITAGDGFRTVNRPAFT